MQLVLFHSIVSTYVFELLVIRHKKLRKLDASGRDVKNGKSVFCFAASSSENEQSHEKIMVCMYMCIDNTG